MRTTFAIHLVAACAISTLATGSFSQQTATPGKALAATTHNAADPAVPVPAVAYRSVFRETSLGVETKTTDWRKANDDVGKFTRGHVDILKLEEQKEMQDATKPIAAPAHKH